MLRRIKDFIKTVLYTKNGVGIIFFIFILKKNVKAKFGNNFSFEVNRVNWSEFMKYVDFFRYFPKGKINGKYATIPYGGRSLVFNCGDYFDVFSLEEVFGFKSYDPFLKGVNLSERVVVDIGAAFGDTPIYFAICGAKKIIAIEPVKTFADLTKENLSLNNFDSLIKIIHAGVGRVPLDDISEDPMFGVVFGGYASFDKEFKIKTPVITLESIVKENSIENGLIKIDCEGWEYDILNSSSDELLRKFEYFVIEYHYGFKGIEERLVKAGFSTRHVDVSLIYVPEREGEYANMNVGMLFARRKSLM